MTNSDYNNGYDNGYRAGMQKVRDMVGPKIEEECAKAIATYREDQAARLEWLADETWALAGEERAQGLLDAAKILRDDS